MEFSKYKTLIKGILATEDLSVYRNADDVFQLLLGMESELGMDDPEVYKIVISVSKYVKNYISGIIARTGSAKFDSLYWDILLFEARNKQVDSGLLYLERNRKDSDKFYEPRREVFQKFGIIEAFQGLLDDRLDLVSISLPPGTGKLLSDDTPVLTLNGWKNHGDLCVGDYVYGLDGQLKRVLHVFQKDYADCLITFSNGEQIQCHENHEWLVFDRHKQKERIITAKELFDSVIETGERGKRGHRYYFMLPCKKPFAGEHKNLAVQPYTFGIWLGNGTNTNPTICGAPQDLEKEMQAIRAEGYSVSWASSHKTTGVSYVGIKCLRAELRKYDMCHSRKTLEKHIPEEYLSASMEQRLELLAGLIDTDGCLSRKERKYHFSTVSPTLRDGFVSLVSTFGWRTCVTAEEPKTSSSGIIGRNTVYTISFSPTFEIPCRLERKQLHEFSSQRRVSITGIKRVSPKIGNCIQVEDGMYCAGRTMIPTHNSTLEIFFLALVGGWFPNDFNLSSAHSSILTRSLYDGINEILNDPYEYTWHEIFPGIKLQGTNAKETTINLERAGRFKTWTFRSIDGSLTGATRCNRFETADDLVSGIEEALNNTRLENLWVKVVNDLRSRRLDGCKELFLATRWSTRDPIGKLKTRFEGSDRAQFIAVPALDESGESNFTYKYNGFSTEYFLEQKELMDEISFKCLYQQQPIEREGLQFPPDALRRFYTDERQVPSTQKVFSVFPDSEPDAIWAVCDTKDKGADFESLPIAYQFGEDYYILDVVFDDTTDYATLDQKTADILIKHNPHRARFESNQAGGRIADNIEKMIKGLCRTNIETRYTTANKETKILANSAWIIKHCLFLESTLYTTQSDYGKFMANLSSYSTRAKVVHDDAPDSMAMLAEYVQGRREAPPTRIIKSPF